MKGLLFLIEWNWGVGIVRRPSQPKPSQGMDPKNRPNSFAFLDFFFCHPQLAPGLDDPPRSGALRWGEKAGEGAPLVPPLIGDCPMLKTTTSRLHPPRPVVPYTTANDKGAVYCFLFIPPSVAWAAGLSRWGHPPLNPGRPPERAGESTRTPLISPEKLALPRPARGAPLASTLAGFFRETGGQWGPHPRTSPCAPVWPTASACGFFCLREE